MFDTDAPDFIGRSLVMPLAWSVPAIWYRVSILTARTGCVVTVAYRLWADCIHWLCADCCVLTARSVGDVVC